MRPSLRGARTLGCCAAAAPSVNGPANAEAEAETEAALCSLRELRLSSRVVRGAEALPCLECCLAWPEPDSCRRWPIRGEPAGVEAAEAPVDGGRCEAAIRPMGQPRITTGAGAAGGVMLRCDVLRVAPAAATDGECGTAYGGGADLGVGTVSESTFSR